ncbi:uncharacterized protein [Nicotiana sylvestris]|uniref:uncharacterized protein n=1 Tax=Nicotiana sylvestris TaxID=4096 RepID=UPI00388C50D3
MGRMLRFMDSMTQAGLFQTDPATSQVGGGAKTPTAQAPGYAAAVYQTPGALPPDGAQPVAAVAPQPRPAADVDPQKLLDRWTRLHPPIFGGEHHEDAQDFIDRYRDRLNNMRILESHGVDFTNFQLEGMARRWWQSYVLGRPAGSPPFTWGQFTQLFLDRYIPPSEKKELRYQFEHLEQGQMFVTNYEVRIEGYRQRGREQIQQDKRAQFSGEFRGAPARGRGHFGRGQPSRPPYLAPPPPPRGAPVRPYFSAILESSYRPPAIQGSSGGYSGHQDSSSAYFSAMPKSSYRPLAIHGSSSGYLGQQAQTSGQQAMVPRVCYECGDPGHMKRTCPRLRGKVVQQGQQPMISAPAAPPPRGRGQAGRGHPRGEGQAGRCHPATTQSGGGLPAGTPAIFYARPARPDALATDIIITGIISVGGRYASVLFDPRSTYSYVSSMFARFLVISPEPLGTPVHVSTPMGDSVVVDRIYLSYMVTFCGFETREDLLLLDMIDFEVILGMDWLSPYHSILDCHAKTISLAMPGLPRLEWKLFH